MEKLLIFKRFNTAEEAAEIIAILKEHNIPATYEEEVVLLDDVYLGQNFDQRHLVKIPANYFSQADTLLKSLITVSTEEVEPDYYLLSFSVDELKEVITKKDEWGDYDYALALKLLEKQGITYTSEQLNQLGDSRKAALSEPKDLPNVWLIAGYLSPLLVFSAFSFAIYLAFLGVFIGAFVRLTKKTLPDGTWISAFSERSKNHATWMMISGVVFIPLFVFSLLTVI
jgi:hypothetical protein